MSNKCITINDYMRVPYGASTMKCPIANITLTNEQIWRIISAKYPPYHIYASNPTNLSERVHITKQNFMKTNEELFAKQKVVKEAEVTYEEVAPVTVDKAETVVEEVVETEPAIESDEVMPNTVDEISEDTEIHEVVEEVNEIVPTEIEPVSDSVEEIIKPETQEVVEPVVNTQQESKPNSNYNNYNKNKKKHK